MVSVFKRRCSRQWTRLCSREVIHPDEGRMDFFSKEERVGSEEGDSEQARRSREREEGSAAVLAQELVPVFGGGTQSADGGMKVAHALGHGVSSGIGVKAAVEG